jgi:PAS domain S-box-containing protein
MAEDIGEFATSERRIYASILRDSESIGIEFAMQDDKAPGSNGVITQEEEALLFRALVDSMNDGFGIINADGIFTYVNQRFASMLELKPEQMQGKPITSFVMEDSKRTVLENIDRRTMGQSSQYELEWMKASAQPVATIVSGVPLMNKSGEHSGSYAVITDITKLKDSERRLKDALERFRSIFDESPIGIEVFDENGSLIDINRAALEIAGVEDKSELLGFSLFEDPNLPDDIRTRLRQAETVRYETEFDFSKVQDAALYQTRRSGKIHLEVAVTPLGLEKDGSVRGYLSQILEVTERRDAEEKYRIISNHIGDVLWISDMDLKLTYVTPSVKRLLGYEPQELIGQSLMDLMTPESVRTAVAAIALALKEEEDGPPLTRGDSPPLEIQLTRKDESLVWTETTRTFLRDRQDAPIGVVGTARDIEDRRAAELAMVASEAKYRHLVEQSFQGLVIVAQNPLSIEYVNNAFAAFLGRTQDEVLAFDAEDIERVVHSEDWVIMLKRMQDLLSGDAPAPVPLPIRVFRKDGTMRWLEIFGRVVPYEGTHAIQIVALDVTHRRIADRRVQTQKDRAMLYLDLMSHDFRNQLQIILGSTMVMETMLEAAETRRLLGQIVSAVERCQSMISKVKVTEPLMSLPLRPRRLDNAVAAVVERYSDDHRDIRFETALEPEMAVVESDQFLEQLVTNLIENAVEHNPRPERQVWVTLREVEEGFELSIADNGEGISGSLKGAIFDVSRRYGGVGLHQAKQICDKYGARIEVKDRVSGETSAGAEFVIWFPKAT